MTYHRHMQMHFLDENIWISINISLNFVLKGQINNIPSLVQVMALPRPDNKPLSEPMMISLLTHICFIQPQWVKNCCADMTNIKQCKMVCCWRYGMYFQLREHSYAGTASNNISHIHEFAATEDHPTALSSYDLSYTQQPMEKMSGIL